MPRCLCGHNLRGLETGHCPACSRWFSTGSQLIPLVRRLRCHQGRRRCVVCNLDLSTSPADRCPRCASRFALAIPATAA